MVKRVLILVSSVIFIFIAGCTCACKKGETVKTDSNAVAKKETHVSTKAVTTSAAMDSTKKEEKTDSTKTTAVFGKTAIDSTKTATVSMAPDSAKNQGKADSVKTASVPAGKVIDSTKTAVIASPVVDSLKKGATTTSAKTSNADSLKSVRNTSTQK